MDQTLSVCGIETVQDVGREAKHIERAQRSPSEQIGEQSPARVLECKIRDAIDDTGIENMGDRPRVNRAQSMGQLGEGRLGPERAGHIHRQQAEDQWRPFCRSAVIGDQSAPWERAIDRVAPREELLGPSVRIATRGKHRVDNKPVGP
jgi:hypothetical protein